MPRGRLGRGARIVPRPRIRQLDLQGSQRRLGLLDLGLELVGARLFVLRPRLGDLGRRRDRGGLGDDGLGALGRALGVGALIALSDGTDILGIFATNNWTKLVLGAAGVALIVLSTMPRVGRRERVADDRDVGRRGRFRRRERVVEEDREPVGATTHNGTLDDRR